MLVALPSAGRSRTPVHFACALIASVAFAVSFSATDAQAGTPMISVGHQFSCGVTVAGEGLCWWGQAGDGQGNVPLGKTWSSIAAGFTHSCGVTTSGEGFCWGNLYSGEGNIPSGKTWSAITAGYDHSCGVTTSGEGFCWGNNLAGRNDVPTEKTWSVITAGGFHSCGVTTSGEGLCWGNYSQAGQMDVPSGKTWASINAGWTFSCGVTTSGEGLCWGDNGNSNDLGQTTVPTGKTWSTITAGDSYACGVTTSGQGLCWGANQGGQTTPPSGKTWSAISAGGSHACGLTTSGEGLCWGGDGSTPPDYEEETPGSPADGRLDVPVGKWAGAPVVVETTAAPRLLAAVALTRNPRTTVTSLTLRAWADKSHGANTVTKVEYWNHTGQPKNTRTPNGGYVRAYSPTITLRPGQVAFWVRVKDSKGTWSSWYRTRFSSTGFLGW